MPFAKILVANRGEIACRVIATCRRLGIATVAVYSDADARMPHVLMADEAVFIGSAPAAESYLCADKIIAAALTTGADAIHPGYGFLSENAAFARTIAATPGLTFIGPSPDSILAIGDKISSKKLLASQPSIPLLPGYAADDQSPATLKREALRIGFPVLIKASAGGGGKGMRIVRDPKNLDEEIAAAKGESLRSFGDERLLLERYVDSAKHIEVQIFGDDSGEVIHVFERECSVQRRHQKVIEETPSPFLTPALRDRITASAVSVGKLIKYKNAGTVEFIVDTKTGNHYFLEVNTRLQVEHPVTELITGLDLVEMQIWVAAGGTLAGGGWTQTRISSRGHAIEARICAEDPTSDFFPSTGPILLFTPPPSTPHTRTDSGIITGSEISVHYDPLIAKISCHAPTRGQCIIALTTTLIRTPVLGVRTNVPFLVAALRDAEFRAGMYDTGLVARMVPKWMPAVEEVEARRKAAAVAAVVVGVVERATQRGGAFKAVRSGFRNVPHRSQLTIVEVEDAGGKAMELSYRVESQDKLVIGDSEVEIIERVVKGNVCTMRLSINGKHSAFNIVNAAQPVEASSKYESVLHMHSPEWNGFATVVSVVNKLYVASAESADSDKVHITPMPCKILAINSPSGTVVNPGDVIVTVESMKMETKIRSLRSGTVNVTVKAGEIVKAGVIIATVS